MNKRNISILLILALVFSSICIAFADTENTETELDTTKEPEQEIYYWLDNGIWLLDYNGKVWGNNIPYGSVQHNETTIAFGNNIEVVGCHFFQYGSPDEPFVIQPKQDNCNSNLVEKTDKHYMTEYLPKVTKSLTNLIATNVAPNKVKLSYDVLLESLEDYETGADYQERTKKGLNPQFDTLYGIWGNKRLCQLQDEKVASSIAHMTTLDYSTTKQKLYQVVMPVVIEYVITDITCEKCGVCKLAKGTDHYCSANSCEHFGTTECLCYDYEKEEVPSGNPVEVITWTATKTHTYTSGMHKKICEHKYTYEARLKTNATLTAAHQDVRTKSKEPTFKSGYGFSVDAVSTITVKQIADSGSCGQHKTRASKNEVKPVTDGEVRTNWTVKLRDNNKVTQPKNVKMAKPKISGLTSTFETAPNPLSKYNNKQIYTDVALAGTREKPVVHYVTLRVTGGGVGNQKFLQDTKLKFTIVGDMYSDDFTVGG